MSWFPRLYGDLRLLGVAAWSIAVARAMLIARLMQEIKSFSQSRRYIAINKDEREIHQGHLD